ncbi:MAG: hypothetical protein IKX91_02535, partial [Firmicutes bacterium]|nr:hypothetical protein [Bacillota bacterium]
MKKRIFLVSLLALLIAVAALCALPAKADGAVIYISDLGTGDGSSPDNPLGANADFLAACETGVATSNISQGSALYKASQAVAAGGTIVIVGDTTVALGTTAQSSGTNNAYTYGHTGHITVTSVYGGVDYRSTNGAELVFRSTHQNLRLHMSGPMTFENLDFTMLYSGSLYTYIPCRAFVTVFGEGLNMRTTTDPTLATYDATPVNAKLPRICGGYMWSSFSKKSGRNDLVNLTILSGSYYSVAGLGNFPNGSFTLIGDVNMTFGACEIKGNLYGMYDASPRSNVILNGNINMTFTGTTVSVGNVFVTTGASVSGVATSSATNFCKLNGDANVVVNDGTTFNTTFYVTPTVQAASDGNVNYGQVVGNVDITVNAGTAGVNFVRIDLGAQGFATSHASDPTKGKLTLKFNGDNWHASSTTLNSFYFAGSGSNFVSSGGYRYSVLDFSGMTYNEFWNHVNNSNNTPVYNGFRYVSGYAVVPTVQPDGLGIAQYGAGAAAYGVNEVVEPIDVITSISCAAQQYTAGQHFSLVGEDLTFTKQSGTTENKTVGTDIDASVFAYTDPGELAVAMDGNEIAVTYPAEWNPLGTAIVFNVPISVEPAAKTFTSLAVTTNPTRTVYAINDTFAPAGMVVTAFYSDSTSDVVALENLTGLPSLLDLTAIGGTLGSKTFVLSYTSLGATQTADLVITVTDKINSVTYADIPTAVLNDDAVDFSGMTATVVYEVAGEVAATSADFTVGSYVNTMYNTELQSKRFKVQVTYTDANGLTKAQDIYVPVVSDLTVVNNTIYISNTGVGDGQSAASPLGFDALYPTGIWADVNKEHNSSAVYLFDGNFDQVPSCIYQGSPLYRAIYALLETGGRIVIVDEATFGPGGNGVAHNYITGNATCNIYLPTWNHEIEIVGKDASSVLSYDARLTNPRWHFSGPVNIHGLTLSIDYTSYSTVRPAMAFGGYNSTLDATNMIKRQFDYANGVVEDTFAEKDIGAETAHDPDIGAGKMWGNYSTQNGNATFALTGGKWRFFDATGNTSVSTSGYVVTGDTTII